jgi:uroporphyrinogen-III synthase
MKVKTILVSQPPPSAEHSPYFDLSEKQKVKIDFRSFIHVEGEPSREVRNQKIDFANFSAVIFTSRNAIDNYFRLAEEMRFKVPDDMKYFCQSEAVAYYLQKYVVYRKRKIYVGERTFQDLTKLIKKHKTEKFLLPSSDKLKPIIPQILDELEVSWERAVLFRTVVSDLSDLKNVYYDVLVFFSPSGIQSLFQNFPDFEQNKTLIAVFGNTTVKAAEEAGLRVDIAAPTKERPSMTMALEHYIKNMNKG